MNKSKDPVNQDLIDLNSKLAYAKVGIMNLGVFHEDHRRLLFTLSRYKFVAKMFQGFGTVFEIDYGHIFYSSVVKKIVQKIYYYSL